MAQFTDRYWAFGDSSAIDFRNLTNPLPDQSIVRVRGDCSSICDSLGNLLFYTASPDIYLWTQTTYYKIGYVVNKNHQYMNNGDSIASTLGYQEMITVPDPGNSSRFYLFTCGVTSTPIPGFYYSVIDLNYYGGLGRVVQKNIQLQTFPICDGLAAVKHGNGRDWWVVFKHWDTVNDDFYFYLVTPTGLSGPFIQTIGTVSENGISRMKFSKNGNKLFVVNAANLIESFDFDRCTGLLSNTNTIQPEGTFGPYTWYWGFALSPNTSRLYVSSIYNGMNNDTSYLFQFDLTAGNILASKDTLYTLVSPSVSGMLQSGPDDKIYYSSDLEFNPDDCEFSWLYCDTSYYPENMNISVINQPDNLGAACDFQPFSFYLGGHRTYYGLPNNPNYELGPDTNSICDTITVVNDLPQHIKEKLYVWFNSHWQTAFINAQHLKGKSYALQIYDVAGRNIFKEEGKLDSEFYSKNLNCAAFSNGMYIVSLTTEKEMLNQKFIIEK